MKFVAAECTASILPVHRVWLHRFLGHETLEMRGLGELEPNVDRRLRTLAYGRNLGPRLDPSPISNVQEDGVA